MENMKIKNEKSENRKELLDTGFIFHLWVSKIEK